MYVVNDLHGAPALIEKTVHAIEGLKPDDVLVINGDGAGSRVPIMNRIVKIYYEVRRGETEMKVLLNSVAEVIGEPPVIPQEWIYETVHAGIFRKLLAERYRAFAECAKKELQEVIEQTLAPLSRAAANTGVKIIYLPGNGEIVTDDFMTDDITIERTVHPTNRFYQKIASEGFFTRFDMTYVPYIKRLTSDTVLIGTNLLDLDESSINYHLESHGLLNATISKVIVHYPPAIAPIGGAFSFWSPNKTDVQRAAALENILGRLAFGSDAVIYFGHIHLGAYDPRMNPYPETMGFRVKDRRCVWVKPGTVIKIV